MNCVGGSGACHITCVDGTVLDCEYKLTSCTSGYGAGLDANKNWFAFAFGPGINQKSREQIAATVHQAASSLPAQNVSSAQNAAPAQNSESAGTSKSEQPSISVGTGFFVSPDGLLVTADHVVQGQKKISVMTRRGDVLDAVLINDDAANDLALLRVKTLAKPLPVESTVSVAVGQEVLTLGYPLAQLQGTEQKATFGHINSLSGIHDDVRLMQIDVPVQPGNSGGPLLDEHGRVIGVVTAVLDSAAALKLTGSLPQNVNYATKADYLIPLLSHEGVSAGARVNRAPAASPADVISRVRDSVVLVVAQ